MLLLLHVLTAIVSIFITTYSVVRPRKNLLSAGYGLAGATLASGTILVISSGSNLLRSCLTGIAYFGVVAVGLRVAQKRLAKQEIDK